MNKETILKEIKRLNDIKTIKIDNGTDTERVIFNSEDVFNLFEDEQNGLNPFDDYTYIWLSSFLDRVEEHLNYNEFEDLDTLKEEMQDNISEWADSETNVYTSGLTKWLSDSNFNAEYLDRAVKELGAKENIISVAQYLRIEECFNYYLDALIKHLEGLQDD